jgi:NAD+ synthase
MAALYFVANSLNYLVAGTGNRSELTIGYFTKHGDGGVDVLPLGSLSRVRQRLPRRRTRRAARHPRQAPVRASGPVRRMKSRWDSATTISSVT